MENRKQAHDSLSTVSRLDHLDFIMKNLEIKQNLAKWGSNSNISGMETHQVPLNLAIREAYFKGSLLERVASLEQRLFQLSLAMESSNTSTGTPGDASSSQESKTEIPASSLPTFNSNPYQDHYKQELQVLLDTAEIQEKSNKGQQQTRKHESPVKHGRKKPNSEEKTCKGGKKRASPNWPRFKLLGC